MMRIVWYWLAVVSVTLIGCAGDPDQGSATENVSGAIRIDLESSDADRLLGFYFGGFVDPDGGDPVEAGLLEKREKTWFLRNEEAWTSELPTVSRAQLRTLWEDQEASGSITEDALEAFIRTSYYEVRGIPPSISALTAEMGAWSEPDWFRISLRGSMVPLERTTWVRRSAIESALDRMTSLDDPVIYDAHTVFVGEHHDEGALVETTFMRKRADGFWDFWAYDDAGELIDRVRKEPRDMLIPTRCTGCHFGDRQFEPERSFPGEARPGPTGERALYIPDAWRDSAVASSLQEHARRSDTILGLYATLYLAEAASSSAGPSAYLEKFGIEPIGQ